MKSKIYKLILLVILTFPVLVFAGGKVQVYPTITNSHGGGLFAKDLWTQIVYDNESKSQSQNLVPTYDLGDSFTEPTSYKVSANPPWPYTFKFDSNCSGEVSTGQFIVCHINYQDDATTTNPVFTAQFPIKKEIISTPIQEVQPVLTVETGVSQVIATTTLDQDRIELMKRIIVLLEQIVQLLSERLSKINV